MLNKITLPDNIVAGCIFFEESEKEVIMGRLFFIKISN
jgi:hypothetical protein